MIVTFDAMMELWDKERIERLFTLAEEKGLKKKTLVSMIDLDRSFISRLKNRDEPVRLLYSNAMSWVEQFVKGMPTPAVKIEEWDARRVEQLFALAEQKGLSKGALEKYIDLGQATLWRLRNTDEPVRLLYSNSMALVEQWLKEFTPIQQTKRKGKE